MKRKKKALKPARGARAAGKSGMAGATPSALETDAQHELFERLRVLRKELADAEGVPPYVVFSDAALRGMCVALPRTDDEFLAVSGVGPVKLRRYGRAFLAEINGARR